MIKASNLDYHVGQKQILNDINITAPLGKVTAIVGPNGSGKSTLLRCLSGALTITGGHITLDDKPLNSYSLAALAKRRAVLSQSTTISFPFSAKEIVQMGRNPFSNVLSEQTENDMLEEIMTLLDVWDLRDRLVPTLSGGEQQRVQMSRALMQIWQQKDAYLFLDEPTSALDLKHQHHLLEITNELVIQKNLAVAVVIHDIHLARRYSHQAWLLQSGNVFAHGDSKTALSWDNLAQLFDVPAELLKT